MRRIPVLLLLAFVCVCSSYSLELDWDSLTNMTEVTTPAVVPTPEPQMPNSYLSSGKIEPIVLESYARRFDLVFFISMPISFYLMMNIIQIRNQLLTPLNAGLTDMDWNYIYWNTLITSFIVAYQDNVFYYNKHPDIPISRPALTENQANVLFQIPVLCYRF